MNVFGIDSFLRNSGKVVSLLTSGPVLITRRRKSNLVLVDADEFLSLISNDPKYSEFVSVLSDVSQKSNGS